MERSLSSCSFCKCQDKEILASLNTLCKSSEHDQGFLFPSMVIGETGIKKRSCTELAGPSALPAMVYGQYWDIQPTGSVKTSR